MSRPGAFVVPRDGAPYLTVRLDFELTAARRCGNGFGYVNASAGSGPSASVGFKQRCGKDGRVLRWSTVTTAGVRRGVVRSRRVAVSVTNYTLIADEQPGRHELSFSLETAKGFHVKGVRIRPTSGLRPTHEPPYTVALDIDPHEARTVPGEPVVIDVAVRNAGATPARRVGLAVIESADVVVQDRRVLTGWPAVEPKSVVRRRLRLLPKRAGAWKVDVAVESSKGSDIETISLVAAAPATAAVGAGEGDTGWLPLAAAWSLVVCGAYFCYRRYGPSRAAVRSRTSTSALPAAITAAKTRPTQPPQRTE